MNKATLLLTRKDENRNPVGPLLAEIEFLKPVTSTESLYSFDLDSQDGNKLEFFLRGDNCTTFFNALVDLTDSGTQSTNMLSTVDSSGNDKGMLKVSVAKLKTYIDKISLYSYVFELDDGAPFAFNLTSSDASIYFLNLDYLIWTNPPNPLN